MTHTKGDARDFPDDIQHKLRGGLNVRNKNNGELTPGKKHGMSWRLHTIRMMKSATNASLLGRWGTPLGQQQWGTQSPQQKYPLLGDGGCHVGDKKWGTQSTQEKLLIGRWGMPLGQQKWGTRTHCCSGDGGCRSGSKNGGLKVNNKSIASRSMGDAV
jgi:hypothetical protein